MQLLGRHPAIVVPEIYPHEARMLVYWAQVTTVLGEAGEHDDYPFAAITADPRSLRRNPYVHAQLGLSPLHRSVMMTGLRHAVDAFARERVRAHYGAMAHFQGKRGVRYFAEKGAFLPEIDRIWPNRRRVVLVRDFRAVLASRMAFNAKRGSLDFGQELGMTPVEYARALAANFDAHSRVWAVADGATLRYEDLVTAPRRTLTSLFRSLGLDATPATVASVMAGFTSATTRPDHHMTSGSARQSLDAWRSSFDAAAREAITEILRAPLERCGYL